MATISGLDTRGVSRLSTLEDGRVVLTFAGKDGKDRNVFVPTTSMPGLLATMMSFIAKLTIPAQAGGAVPPGAPILGVKEFAVGSNDKGDEYLLGLTIGNDLELHFLLNANRAQSIATALVRTLEKHGKSHPLSDPEGSEY